MAAATPAASAGAPLPSTPSPCDLFATESEAYFCLCCNVRCSGLALLVGSHTSHDYLPLSDALLYLPAALLREAREVVQEAEENFTKPWRVQDQQREGTLLHLLELRRSKVAAVAQILAELRQVDDRLLRVTEAKALDVANWRHQLRGLHRKMEKLHRGATALSACLAPASPSPVGDGTANVDGERSQGATTSRTPWSQKPHLAQKELSQVCQVLQMQLAQLQEEEFASVQRLEAWHRLLSEVPWGSNASGSLSYAADSIGGKKDDAQRAAPSTAAPGAAAAGIIQTPTHEPPPPSRSCSSELWHASKAAARNAPCTSAPDASLGQLQQNASLPPSLEADASAAACDPLHLPDAEVVLLQHALHNINGALRQRLLHAAAASLSSSSSSRSPPTSHHAFGREATDTGITISGLPPLPDATPLRSMQDFTKSNSSSDAAATGAQQSSAHMSERITDRAGIATAAYATLSARGRQQESSPVPRRAEVTAPVTSAETETALDAAEEAQRRVWRQSLHLREQEMKESLNQLLQNVTTASSTPPSRARGSVEATDDAGRPASSAVCSSIPAYQRSWESR
ncbi:hypothetical protein LSCM1_05554 [Leishmania martiniquensis]|uniref:Uncharacterized protein n=1 Tax=Leishmania martiniquensis TaxID=1580590 RepID=A0A836KSW2_9TRYP|nr:hypothetical protein LSCM1_05554 [Leishmania martiniquensis]